MSFLKKKSQIVESVEDFSDVGIFVQDRDRLLQMAIIDLTEEDLRLLRRVKPFVEVRIREVVEAFYKALEATQFQNIISQHSSSERLRQTLRHHIIEMMEGRIDETYIENLHKVSRRHVRIGLTTRWYLAAFQKLEGGLRQIIFSLDVSFEDKTKMIDAIGKICSFEIQLVLEEYENVSVNMQAEQQNQIKQEVKTVLMV